MSATIRDIAKNAGVSPMTVSRVINNKPGVSDTTRTKVNLALKELNYSPSRTVNRGVPSKSDLIGLIVPDIANPFFAPIVQGVEKVAAKAGFRVLICNSESDLRLERDYTYDLAAHGVVGLIVAPVSDQSRIHLEWVREQFIPLVLLDREVADFECDSVGVDNVQGARLLTDHLIGIGHRRICFVSDSFEVSTGRERLRGFREAMRAAGLAIDDDLIHVTTPDLLGGYRAAQQILGMAQRPTALVAVNNMTALGLVKALREAGTAIPDDIALACFDDVQHLAIISPFLTVIDQPSETMARVAAQLLTERIKIDFNKSPRHVKFPGELIVRMSCGSKLDRIHG